MGIIRFSFFNSNNIKMVLQKYDRTKRTLQTKEFDDKVKIYLSQLQSNLDNLSLWR